MMSKTVENKAEDAMKTRRKRDYSTHYEWTQELNLDVYKCYLKAREDPSLGYMTRLKTYWDMLHPELTLFNAKQLRQQATFVETKSDFTIDAKSPHLKLEAILSELKADITVKNVKKTPNGSSDNEPFNVLQPSSNQQKNTDNVPAKKPAKFEVNNNGCHISNGDGKISKETKTNKKSSAGKHYYEPVMTTGAPVKHLYREAMEQVHSYNSKLLLERRLRMPYIDNQTGLAQQDCHLWVSRVQRCAPIKEGQIYSYPSRRWMVRKRPDFIGASKVEKKPAVDGEDNVTDGIPEADKSGGVKGDDNSLESSVHTPVTTFEDYYDEDVFDSELDSDEEFGSRKRKRKTGKNSRSSKKSNMALKFGEKLRPGTNDMYRTEDKRKVYECQICNKRYKNQQSLRYHYEHHNHNLGETQNAVNGTNHEPSQPTDQPPPDHVAGAKRKKGMPPSSYCDFCLGSVEVNKKSGSSEELISCADCGRSGHPSCLQFNENLTEQCKKYKWQCIECKCCCLCGTSDNDEQLLFCDDCDRGYHMYCLNPPIAEPPEGSWQCQLCEARVKGEDITKVSVLPQHMDFGSGPAAPNDTNSGPSAADNPVSSEPGAVPRSAQDNVPSTTALSSVNTSHAPIQTNGHGPVSLPVHTSAHPMAHRAMHGGPHGPGHPQMHASHHMPPYGSQHPPPYPPQYGSQYPPQYPPQYGSPYAPPPPYAQHPYPSSHHAQQNSSQHGPPDPSQHPPQYGSQHGPQYPPHAMRHPLQPIPQHPQLGGSQRPPHLGPRSLPHSLHNTSHMQPRPPHSTTHSSQHASPNLPRHDAPQNGPPQPHAPQQSSEHTKPATQHELQQQTQPPPLPPPQPPPQPTEQIPTSAADTSSHPEGNNTSDEPVPTRNATGTPPTKELEATSTSS